MGRDAVLVLGGWAAGGNRGDLRWGVEGIHPGPRGRQGAVPRARPGAPGRPVAAWCGGLHPAPRRPNVPTPASAGTRDATMGGDDVETPRRRRRRGTPLLSARVRAGRFFARVSRSLVREFSPCIICALFPFAVMWGCPAPVPLLTKNVRK